MRKKKEKEEEDECRRAGGGTFSTVTHLRTAMRDKLLLLVLLSVQPAEASSGPYRVDAEGRCRDAEKEYQPPGSSLCCKRCRPGQFLKRQCSETSDSDCVDCGPGLHMETWNYYKNCFICTKCKENKGLQYAQRCSSDRNARCVCQPGRFCRMGFDDPYCKDCIGYRTCRVGSGVSRPGSAESDVTCERCPDGTFSDTDSASDRCRPHANCSRSAVVRRGNAASDTLCEGQTATTTAAAATAAAEQMTATATATATASASAVEGGWASAAPPTPGGTTQFVRPSLSQEKFHPSTERAPPSTQPVGQLGARVGAVTGVLGVVFLLVVLLLFFLCRRVFRRDSARLDAKVDANGNCQSDDKISPIYLGESQLTTFTVASPEQQCLLGTETLCRSPSRNSGRTSAGGDGHDGHESVRPPQPTLVCDRPHSVLSEPTTLLSHTPLGPSQPGAPSWPGASSQPGAPSEPPPQPGAPSQPPSQPGAPSQPPSQPGAPSQPPPHPTSPQISRPVTPGPHVNVSITLNIANGACGAPSCSHAGPTPADRDLPFGEEEEGVGAPRQEGGKESLVSVQEGDSGRT